MSALVTQRADVAIAAAQATADIVDSWVNRKRRFFADTAFDEEAVVNRALDGLLAAVRDGVGGRQVTQHIALVPASLREAAERAAQGGDTDANPSTPAAGARGSAADRTGSTGWRAPITP